MTQNLQNHIIFKKKKIVLHFLVKLLHQFLNNLVCTCQNLPWANYSLVLKLGNPFGMHKKAFKELVMCFSLAT